MLYKFFSEKNTPYFVFIFGVVILIILGYMIYRQFRFEKAFSNGKVKLISRVEVDPITGCGKVILSVVNRNFNAIEIRGIGYKHFNTDYDFLATYKEAHDLRPTDKLFIPSRESIEVVIDLDILKIKLNSSNIKKFKAYAIDVYGNYVLKKAANVEKYIEAFFKKIEFVEKVKAMPKDKQMSYYAKEEKLDNRIKDILNKSVETKLHKDDLNNIVDANEPIANEENVDENKNNIEEIIETNIDENVGNTEYENEYEANKSVIEEEEAFDNLVSDELKAKENELLSVEEDTATPIEEEENNSEDNGENKNNNEENE